MEDFDITKPCSECGAHIGMENLEDYICRIFSCSRCSRYEDGKKSLIMKELFKIHNNNDIMNAIQNVLQDWKDRHQHIINKQMYK